MRKEEFGLILNLAQVSTHVLNFLVDARNSAMPSEEGSSKHPVVPGAHSLVGKKETSINRSRRKKKKTMVKDYNTGSVCFGRWRRRRLWVILFLISRAFTKL